MKKGFTIAETVITVAILGVIAAVTIPVLNKTQPNKDVVMYNKALYTIQNAVSQVAERSFEIAASQEGYDVSEYEPDKFLENIPARVVCREIANVLNVSGQVNCNQNGSYENPNFITTDGMRFWGIGHGSNFTGKANPGDNDGEGIDMDYNLTEADKKARLKAKYPDATKRPTWSDKEYGLKIDVEGDGKVHAPNWTAYSYENFLLENNKK